MIPTLRVAPFVLASLLALSPTTAQTPPAGGTPPAPAKGQDKEVADKLAALKEVVADKKFARDDEGVKLIDELLIKSKAGLEAKDQAAMVKGLDAVLSDGKLRPPDNTKLYIGAVQALGYCGAEGAKVLHDVYVDKRYPEKRDWVPFREQVLKNLGRTKDESQIKFLTNEAVRSPEAGLAAAATEALGNFDEAKEALRKEIVSELIKCRGSLEEKASQIGTNIDGQNAKDRLAALGDRWNGTLAKLTKQNFTTFREWQAWHNKNKTLPW